MPLNLLIDGEILRYQAPPIKATGSVRYSPSFTVVLAEIKIVGYVPRMIIDDESAFLVLVTASGTIHYFNFDVAHKPAVAALQEVLGFRIAGVVPGSYEDEMNWQSFIVLPSHLVNRPLFQPWSWLTPRGFLKNLGKALSMDNPAWERLSDEAKMYLAATT